MTDAGPRYSTTMSHLAANGQPRRGGAGRFAQFPDLLEPDVDIYKAAAPPITLHILAGTLAAGS
jgi:hypothetical protein